MPWKKRKRTMPVQFGQIGKTKSFPFTKRMGLRNWNIQPTSRCSRLQSSEERDRTMMKVDNNLPQPESMVKNFGS